MKTLMLLTMSSILNFAEQKPSSPDEQLVRETIISFAKAADVNDDQKLATFLDDNYRIVMNQLFGSDVVAIMPKEVYLEKIRTKEFGGDTRKVEFQSLSMNGMNAVVKVKFAGTKMTFVSLITLVKNKDQEWKIISEVPTIS